MNKHERILVENPEMVWENRAEYEVRTELARRGIENEPEPEKCPHCGSEEFKCCSGFAGESIASSAVVDRQTGH